MPSLAEHTADLPHLQDRLWQTSHLGIEADLEAVYEQNDVRVGWPDGARRIFEGLAKDHTAAIIGVALGDEGKGRIVDNKIQALLDIAGLEVVYVVRFQGGSNAGHTVEKGDTHLALHQVPSGVLYPEAVGVMDQGMVIHPEDLQTEIEYAENKVGDLRGKLFLSRKAILTTDLERAEETLNDIRSSGKSGGGTKRGISPSYAHHYDRLGLTIADLMEEGWRVKLGERYNRYAVEFGVHGQILSEMEVPDYRATLESGKEQKRNVGTKEEFLNRLEAVRTWMLQRDEGLREEKRMVTNTFILHRDIYTALNRGVIFEGAQAVGLHAWLGTRPDVTSSDTSAHGIMSGTGVWRVQDVADRLGVFKLTYTSSVGARRMPTHIPLEKTVRSEADLPERATAEQRRAAWIREEAHEFGTTTGRPRDILHLDLPMISYNARMAGIEMLGGTHLDIAREVDEHTGEQETIRVCTHYTRNGVPVPYQPGLEYQEGVTPHYVYLPSWNGKAVQSAKTFDDLPINAQKFLSFIERRLGYPIVVATTGPKREQIVELPGYRSN